MTTDPLLLAQVPVVDGTYVLYLVLRILHILSAIVIVGGLVYARIVLCPAGADIFAGRRQVWSRWVALASLFLLVSGLMNFLNINSVAKAAGTPLAPIYHMLFGGKFILGLFVMFVAAILAGKTTLADKFRQNSGLWLNIALVASLVIVALGAILRTLHS